MSEQTNLLAAESRQPSGSRETRRLRRTGAVPGIIYGGGEDPVPFAIDARELRHALANAGAVLNFKLDNGNTTPVVVKELVRHPVSGETTHLDLLRVNLNTAIQAQVTIELTGAEDAPGLKTGGILEQPLREVTIEALPGSIPDTIQFDVSGLEVGDTITLAQLVPPAGVTIISDPELTIATVTASRMARAEDEDGIETETELVGDGDAAPEGEGDGDEAAAESGDDTAASSDE